MIPPQLEPTESVLGHASNQLDMQRDVVRTDIPKIVEDVVAEHKSHMISLSTLFLDRSNPDRVFRKGEQGFWTGYLSLSLYISLLPHKHIHIHTFI